MKELDNELLEAKWEDEVIRREEKGHSRRLHYYIHVLRGAGVSHGQHVGFEARAETVVSCFFDFFRVQCQKIGHVFFGCTLNR